MQESRQYINRKRIKRIKRNRRILFVVLLVFVITIIGLKINKQVKNSQYPSFSTPDGEFTQNAQSSSDNNSALDSSGKEWYLALVNKWNPIVQNYTIETVELTGGECVDKRIYPYLQDMFDAARNEGIYPIVASGYRTGKEQTEIYNNKIAAYKADGFSNSEAKEEAEFWVAIPGTSEHELGLSVDINADGVNSKGTDVYDWLKANAHLYGFINRYPSGKTEMTGVFHEPWHYRYVGVEAATEIYNQGVCLEEYLEQIK